MSARTKGQSRHSRGKLDPSATGDLGKNLTASSGDTRGHASSKGMDGAGEIAQELRAHTDLAEEPSLVLRIHAGQLTMACNSLSWAI